MSEPSLLLVPMITGRSRARPVAKTVTVKRLDVPFDPLQGGELVQQAEVGAGYGWVSEEAQRAETVVE